MTDREMHIGIDLGLQAINSNVFGVLQDEEKDYYINLVTKELITLALTEERNTIYDINTYSDIRQYYEQLQKYIVSTELGIEEAAGLGYVYSNLPASMYSSSVTSGVLYHGAKYKVIIAGTTDLSDFGSTNPPVINTEFECSLPLQSGTTAAVVLGEKYKIINAGGIDWTTYGATSSNPGVEFICTTAGSITGGSDIELQNLTDTPTWVTTDLAVTQDIGYFLNIDTKSSTTIGNPISSGALTLNTKYIVTTVGTTDLSVAGGVANPSLNYIFTCDDLTTITWDGDTILYKIDDNDNRLVKAQDVGSFLNNSFGSVKTSPVSIFANNGLRVYHDNKFNIYRLFIDYIIVPISVNLDKGINSDLPLSVHSFLVDLVVKRIAATTGNPTYSALVNEEKDKESK